MKTIPNFFRVDFSAHANFLIDLQVGPLSDDDKASLAAIMGAEDTGVGAGQWTQQKGGEYSLADSEVIYAGENNLELPTHPHFEYVVGISLPEGKRTYLHFNL